VVEIIHRHPEPLELAQFRADNPTAGPEDFGSLTFQPVKRSVKAKLSADQGGLCAYCESQLDPTAGQIDHVKPKGTQAHQHLTFVYTNFVHSCCHQPKHCGQKKKDGVLPIEPGSGCNDLFVLTKDGVISPVVGASKQQRHQVRQTVGMLGLNHATLQLERQRWVKSAEEVLKMYPQDFLQFIQDKPFRFILQRLIA
jgi:uncharacterized protein (TIGR02646 family)